MAERAAGIGQELRELREAAGLTQTEAATGIGVALQTISRWELEKRRIKAEDFASAHAFYQTAIEERNRRVHGLNQMVPRGTRDNLRDRPSKAGLVPSGVESMIEAVKRQMIREDCTDAEVDFIESASRNPDVSRMIYLDAGGSPTFDQLIEGYEELFDSIRELLRRRIARRAEASVPKPIEPKDMPRLVAERAEQVYGAKPKRRTK